MHSTRTLTIVRMAGARGTSDCCGDGSDATGTESKYNGIWNGHRTDRKCRALLLWRMVQAKGIHAQRRNTGGNGRSVKRGRKKMQVCERNTRTGTLNENNGCGICVDVIQHVTLGKVDRVLAQYLHRRPWTRIRSAATSQRYLQKHAPWLSIVRGANSTSKMELISFL